jgi:glycosyltransferase involved in cell wall biosynthesis
VSFSRLLFASCHGYVDHASGAALATRDILSLLARDGVDCRVLSTGVLDYERETPLRPVLDSLGIPIHQAYAQLSDGHSVEVFDFELDGVRTTVMPTVSSLPTRSPNREESLRFLDLLDQVLARFRPQALLTYGGHPVNLELMARARRRGVPVVFHLHNFSYTDRRAFTDASAVLVPSDFSRRYHAQRIGLESTAIPLPIIASRVLVPTEERKPFYLTFVNPQPAKGMTVFARIASELFAKRPDIPILVVEGRGPADRLANLGLDLAGLTNLHRMPNTPDPREIYKVTKALLVPSLWRESFGRVAAEGLANGIPVLASDRGALPEILGDSGFLFTIPERCTPTSGLVPTAREVAPWIATIERLWDDGAWAQAHSQRALEEAKRWAPDVITSRYREFFETQSRSAGGANERPEH